MVDVSTVLALMVLPLTRLLFTMEALRLLSMIVLLWMVELKTVPLLTVAFLKVELSASVPTNVTFWSMLPKTDPFSSLLLTIVELVILVASA